MMTFGRHSGRKCVLTLAISLWCVPAMSQTEIAQTQAAIDAARAAQQTAMAWMNEGKNALRADADQAAVKADGVALSKAVVAVAVAIRGIPEAERGKPEYQKFIEALEELKIALGEIGRAAPGLFLSPTGQRKAQELNGYFDQLAKYRKEVESGGPQAARALHDMQNYLGRAVRAYKGMSGEDRASPNGQALAGELRQLQGVVNDAVQGEADGRAVAQEAKEQCKKFDQEVVRQGNNRAQMKQMIRLLKGQGTTRSGASLNDERVEEWKQRVAEQQRLVETLKSYCTEDARKVLSHCKQTHGKPRVEGLYAETDPIVWCMAAEKATDLMLDELMQFVERSDTKATQRFSPEELEGNEGWLAVDKAVTWESHFSFSPEAANEKLGQFKEIFDAIGVDMDDTSSFFAKRVENLAAMEAEVRRLAARWKLPDAGKKHYGIGLAKKTIQRWYKGAKVIKAAGSTGDWSVTKNALGVPLYRSRFGWILFEPKGEPFCQLRTFVVSEDHAGGGKYKKAKHVTFSRLRWQNCSN